jgi:putative sigma-54 modulation protein
VNISITFRHMDASEAIKVYANDKVAKLQKFLRQPMTAKVTLSIDRLKHIAETRISSGGAHIEAKQSTGDIYESIDRVIDKLERQIRGAKGAAQSKKRRSGDSLRTTTGSAAERVAAASAAVAKKTTKKAATKKKVTKSGGSTTAKKR